MSEIACMNDDSGESLSLSLYPFSYRIVIKISSKLVNSFKIYEQDIWISKVYIYFIVYFIVDVQKYKCKFFCNVKLLLVLNVWSNTDNILSNKFHFAIQSSQISKVYKITPILNIYLIDLTDRARARPRKMIIILNQTSKSRNWNEK